MTRTTFILPTAAALILTVSCSMPSDGSGLPAADPSGPADNGLQIDEASGLVAGLSFDENIDADSPVVIEGAVWTDGLSGSALLFNGYDHFVAVPDDDSLTLASEGTIMAWIYAYSHKPFAGILHKGEQPDFSDESWSLQFWGSTGQLALYLYNEAGTSMNVKSTVNVATGRWVHLAATWDSATVRVYIDGEEDNSMANSIGEIRDSDGRLIIGAQLSSDYNATYGHVGFDGIIDEVGVYDHAFGPAEILEAFQALDPNA